MKPANEGLNFATIFKFAPKPPAARITDFALTVILFPCLPCAKTPITSPLSFVKIDVAVVSVIIFIFLRASQAFSRAGIIYAPTGTTFFSAFKGL